MHFVDEEDDKTPFIADSTLSEAEYLSKYNHMVVGGKLTQEYLKLRWQWMNKQAPWQDVCASYMRMPSVINAKQIK